MVWAWPVTRAWMRCYRRSKSHSGDSGHQDAQGLVAPVVTSGATCNRLALGTGAEFFRPLPKSLRAGFYRLQPRTLPGTRPSPGSLPDPLYNRGQQGPSGCPCLQSSSDPGVPPPPLSQSLGLTDDSASYKARGCPVHHSYGQPALDRS